MKVPTDAPELIDAGTGRHEAAFLFGGLDARQLFGTMPTTQAKSNGTGVESAIAKRLRRWQDAIAIFGRDARHTGRPRTLERTGAIATATHTKCVAIFGTMPPAWIRAHSPKARRPGWSPHDVARWHDAARRNATRSGESSLIFPMVQRLESPKDVANSKM